MNIIQNKFVYLVMMALCLNVSSHATVAKFNLVPTTPTQVSVPKNNTIIVQYTVTNQTRLTRTLTMVPIQGVTQITSGIGDCSNPFILTSQGSCLLTLSIDGSQVSTMSQGAPVICKTMGNGNNNPDSLLCSQPIPAYNLSIVSVPAVPSTDLAVYVTNFNANSISLCFQNAQTGLLENCNVSAVGGTLANPEGIATNATTTLMYVANPEANKPITGGTVSLCQINDQTGALSQCHNTGSGFSTPGGVVIDAANVYVYVDNLGNNTVSRCRVNNSTGELSNCITTGSGFIAPSDITLNSAGTFAYVTNLTDNSVSSCEINSGTGALQNCVTTSGFSGPEGITISPSGQYVYVTNNLNNTISLCSFTAGVISGCATTGGVFTGVGNLAFDNTGLRAYVPSSQTAVSVCAVNQVTGALSDCTDSNGTGFSGPSGLLLTALP